MLLAAALVCAACAGRRAPETATIAAAADLQFALEDISGHFHAAHPEFATRIVYGSSGSFYEQIRNQAPFDVFLSADLEYPRKLAAQGLAVKESVFPYAVGRLALWIPANSPLDVKAGIGVLMDSRVKHIAIANPAHAPYGRAAEAALRHFGVYDRVAAKFATAENIAQTLQFAESGAADVALVALSLATAPGVRDRGRYWEVPLDAYPTLWQGGAILKHGAQSKGAAAFRAYLVSDAGRRILQQYGFSLPE